MKPTLQASDERTEIAVPARRAMNSFKHGARTRSLLLPGEDVQEFEALRSDLVHMYRPCTRQELRCVCRIAACQWRVDRHARFGTGFDEQLEALRQDQTGTVAQHVDPDPHRWQHRSDDSGRQEVRFDRLMRQTEQRLFALQVMRRKGLLAPGDRMPEAQDAPQAQPAVTAPAPAAPPPEPHPQAQAESNAPSMGIGASVDESSDRCGERKSGPAPVAVIPRQWQRNTESPLGISASADKQSGQWDERKSWPAPASVLPYRAVPFRPLWLDLRAPPPATRVSSGG